ncbi:hypothetical protein M408DRAFT_27519 [Serendipita vermifera MAFF 305830]|uniref:Uncharacterized protein n=1 Tax=Serendipita vermifera MAFF 305830 TaxID=933852 RepID=A0A0C3AV85_SERVB|nr:hypothetical protein M408DRAFT_27519 [Serendipita vermifera MAFF 305830]
MGIIVFNYLAYQYFSLVTYPSPLPPHDTPSLFAHSICAATKFDSFLTSLLFWTNLQLPWTFLLLGTQIWQVCRQMTTYEVSNLGRYGWMGGRGTSLNTQMGALAGVYPRRLPPTADTRTDMAMVVDYDRLHELLQEGFREAKRRRRERMEEEGLLADEGGARKGFMRRMGIGGWGAMPGIGGGREGYTPRRLFGQSLVSYDFGGWLSIRFLSPVCGWRSQGGRTGGMGGQVG